jgi:hypothetical protein
MRSLRQESNPHLGRTKGACLPLTLRRLEVARWRRRESNPLLLGASEALCHQSFIPEVRTGGVEPPQREAAGLQPVELAGAQRPRERAVRGDRPGSNRRRGDHSPGCFRLHHGHHGETAGTTGLEPAASRLTSERSARLSYVPKEPARSSAGGIRTHVSSS